MISPTSSVHVSSLNQANQAAQTAPRPTQQAAPQHSASSQDTVSLSRAAQQPAASGDVDHDGDSH